MSDEDDDLIRARARIGTTLANKYHLDEVLGVGGMAVVYSATHRNRMRVAVKILHPEISLDPNARERFVREGYVANTVEHPNALKVLDDDEADDGSAFVVMELLKGTAVDALWAEHGRKLPPKAVLTIAYELLDVLTAAHAKGIVHRDIKPANVFVTTDGTVKVLDFGIARLREAAGEFATRTGRCFGTPGFMPPEQALGNTSEIDHRADLWAVGATMFSLLSGRLVHDGENAQQRLVLAATQPARSLATVVSEIHQAVIEIVDKALAFEKMSRWDTADAMRDAIGAAHVVMFGGPISSASLRELLPGSRRLLRSAPTNISCDTPGSSPAVPLARSVDPTVDSTRLLPLVPSRPGIQPRGRTPAHAVFRPSVPTNLPTRQRAILALLGALAVLVIGVAVRWMLLKRPPEAPRPLSTVPEAENAYHDAMKLWHDGATTKADSALRHAVELDPIFATAHIHLAIQTAQDDPAGAQASYKAAFENRDMLRPRDRVLLEASESYVRPWPDLDEFETRLTAATFQFPRDAELQFFLGRTREQQGAHQAAKAAYEEAVSRDSAFVPALAGLANVEHSLGHLPEAKEAAARCIHQSPVATACLEAGYQLLRDTGDCDAAREEAARWSAWEPQSTIASTAFAHSLYAVGAPRRSVEDALSRAWALYPAPKRALSEQWDRMLLAIVDGDLTRAEGLARDCEAQLPASASQYDHARAARFRIDVLYESGDLGSAAKVAHGFLDRMGTWPPFGLEPDPSIVFYEPLYRVGEIEKAELDRQRSRWMLREDQRGLRNHWGWWGVWAGFAETKEEALEALGRMPQLPFPVGARRSVSLDFALGKVYALVGRADDALVPLVRVTNTCSALENAMLVVRARYYLGMAHEHKGNKSEARAAYSRVVATWPKGTKSRTLQDAERRLEALAN